MYHVRSISFQLSQIMLRAGCHFLVVLLRETHTIEEIEKRDLRLVSFFPILKAQSYVSFKTIIANRNEIFLLRREKFFSMKFVLLWFPMMVRIFMLSIPPFTSFNIVLMVLLFMVHVDAFIEWYDLGPFLVISLYVIYRNVKNLVGTELSMANAYCITVIPLSFCFSCLIVTGHRCQCNLEVLESISEKLKRESASKSHFLSTLSHEGLFSLSSSFSFYPLNLINPHH